MSNLDNRVTALLAKPSLKGLAYALEHPETWPEAYAAVGWHFNDCRTCAMGLASALWPKSIDTRNTEGAILTAAETFGISTWQSIVFFAHGNDSTIPRTIAERIRHYLDAGNVPKGA
jgi:hypothetical protein